MARPDTWFRMYNTTLDNPKVQKLSGEMFKAWVNLLCLASKTGGALPSVEDIAFALRKDETEIETLLETFHSRELLDFDGEHYVPHDWDDLQFKSDKSTARVTAYRERKKKQSLRSATETDGNVSCNVSETVQEQSIAEQITPIVPKGTKYPEGFEAFWTIFPNKVGKDAALKAWLKRKKAGDLPSHDELAEAIGRYIHAKPVDREYCNPSTWLNQGRWQDSLAAVPPAGSPRTVQISTPTAADWRSAVARFKRDEYWPMTGFGPQPGYGGCIVPHSILLEFGLAQGAA